VSAFVVGKVHIDALISAFFAYRNRGQSDAEAIQIGRMLIAENYRSVDHRYPRHDHADPTAAALAVEEYTFTDLGHHFAPVTILKAIDCYVYQSCEHEGWQDSEARKWCEALRAEAITELPGYQDAPWQITGRVEFISGKRRVS
jgi:hypothetical protein